MGDFSTAGKPIRKRFTLDRPVTIIDIVSAEEGYFHLTFTYDDPDEWHPGWPEDRTLWPTDLFVDSSHLSMWRAWRELNSPEEIIGRKAIVGYNAGGGRVAIQASVSIGRLL